MYRLNDPLRDPFRRRASFVSPFCSRVGVLKGTFKVLLVHRVCFFIGGIVEPRLWALAACQSLRFGLTLFRKLVFRLHIQHRFLTAAPKANKLRQLPGVFACLLSASPPLHLNLLLHLHLNPLPLRHKGSDQLLRVFTQCCPQLQPTPSSSIGRWPPPKVV